MNGQAVVVGVGESTYYKHGGSPDTEFQLACTAIRRAAEDAGLEMNQLDGLISYMDNRNSPLRIAESATPSTSSFRSQKMSGAIASKPASAAASRWASHWEGSSWSGE